MKFKGLLVVVAGIVCLTFIGCGENDISAWRKKAEQGGAEEQNLLGAAYAQGKGVQQDDKEAVKWYRLAAEQGHAEAQGRLGLCYERGKGVPQDYEEAVKWYLLAAEQGDEIAQYGLGLCYALGQGGVPQDYVQAYAWCNIAAAQGNQITAKARTTILEAILEAMTPKQIEEGQRLFRDYEKKYIKQ